MMQVQKGQVKYKDRSDIICTYGVNDAGKQYYFLDGEKLSNGNFVASTALVEAIDPLVVASNVGVISNTGEIVIPFENKSIKPIADCAILVEKAVPSTQSVIEAVNMRKDPLAATKLVTTPATIKDRMNVKMGNGGRFVFNDQFSEASVFDLDGNNLLSGQYYSFIGLNNGTLYMSKNTVDSEIVEYKLAKEEAKTTSDEVLDIKDVKVSTEVIDKAMQSSVVQAPSVVAPVAPGVPAVPVVPAVSTTPVVSDANVTPVETALNSELDKELHPVDFQPLENAEEFKDIDIKDEDSGEENIFIPTKQEKETRVSLFEGLKLDNSEETTKDDVTVKNSSDTIISDTAAMLAKLIKKNKEQREQIDSYETKMNDLLSFKRQAFNENQKLVKENEMLKKRISELESEITNKTETQVAQKDDLAKLLADAQSLLEE